MFTGKIESSEHYNEIVDMLVSGYNPRQVSKTLLEKYDEKISHTLLNNFRKNSLNVDAAVKKKLLKRKTEQKKERQKKKEKAVTSFDTAVDLQLQNVDKLQRLVDDAAQTKIDFKQLKKSKFYSPEKEIDLKIKYKKLGLEANKQLASILNDDSIDVNVNHDFTDFIDDDLVDKILKEEY